MAFITFLGTGGGRFVLLSQKRASAGIWFGLEDADAIVDPGPGAIIKAWDAGLSPMSLDCVISTHNHLDHYGDVEVMLEAMTHGLRASYGLLAMQADVEPYISEYHRQRANTLIMEEGQDLMIGKTRCTPIPTLNHAGGLGLRIAHGSGDIVYSADTDYDGTLISHYCGARVLILNTIFPKGRMSPTHLNTDDAIKIAGQARPELLVMTHFGVRMLNMGPREQAAMVEKETGIKTVAAYDGARLDLGTLQISQSIRP